MPTPQRIPEGMENALPNITSEELDASRKASKAMPTWDEIGDAFGDEAVRNKKINLDMATREGRANRGKLLDMVTPAWRAEADRGNLFQSKIEKEYLYDDEGRKKVAPVEMAERMAKAQGLHATNKLSFGPPRGGWPVFDKDGKVVG